MQNDKYEELLNKVNQDLPTLPSVVTLILNAILDDKSSVKDIAKIVNTDQAIVSKLLKIVNSAAFGLQKKVATIDHAITILGFDALKNLLLSISVFEFIERGQEDFFNKTHFWRHSLAVATACRSIARRMRYESQDEAYVAGLLHDLGKIILAQMIPDDYNNYLKRLTLNPTLSLQYEDEVLAVNHATMGKLVFEKWNFPLNLQKAVELHHGTAGDEGRITELAAIVSAADFICWTQAFGSFNFFIHPDLDPQIERIIDIRNLKIEPILDEIEKDLDLNSKIFDLKLANPRAFREALQKANFELGRINYLYEETKKKLEKQVNELNALNRVIYKARNGLEPDKLIEIVLDEVRKDFGFDRTIWLSVDHHKKMTIPLNTHSEFQSNLPITAIGCEWNDELGSALYACLGNNKISHLTNFQSDYHPDSCLLRALQSQELLLLPITTDKEVTDLLLLDNTKGKITISEDTVQLLNILAMNLGLALENAKLFQNTIQMAIIDPLTNVYNRRQLDTSLSKEISRAVRFHQPFSIAILDIDNFKVVNDTYGHQTGDVVLKDIAAIITKSSRDVDIVGRLGGDEFWVILPNTSLKNAYTFAERIRLIAERYGLVRQQEFPECRITLSIGLAEFDYNLDDAEGLLSKADKALYQSKGKGRNLVCALS